MCGITVGRILIVHKRTLSSKDKAGLSNLQVAIAGFIEPSVAQTSVVSVI
tara:strand:+ start:219 stop:368 length:150 start_codon:yes stop_codon:yes gene_type:complete